jgi:hypothetical protein
MVDLGKFSQFFVAAQGIFNGIQIFGRVFGAREPE